MNELNFGVKSRYKVKVISKEGNVKSESEWSPNLVLNAGLIALLGGGTSATQVAIRPVCGTGNSPVLPEDTSLNSFLAGANVSSTVSTSRNTASAPYYVMHSYTWRFPQGAAAGNIAEVGAALTNGVPNSSTPLFSRALVVDANGDPSTVTVLSDEYLDITYEIYIYAPSDVSSTFNQMIDGVAQAFSYVIRPANMSVVNDSGWRSSAASGPYVISPTASVSATASASSSGTIQGVANSISGTLSRIGSAAWLGPVNTTSFYRDARYTAGLDESNISISAIQFAAQAVCFQMSLSPAVVKVNTKTYYIDIRYSLSRVP